MMSLVRHYLNRPLRVIGVLWPAALLTPFVPGLPRPTNGGFTWRQELTVAVLISLTFALLRRRNASGRAASGCNASSNDAADGFTRYGWLTAIPLVAFVAWGAASLLWASNVFAALHYSLSWVAYLLFFLLMLRASASPRVLRSSLMLLAAVVLIISAANIVGYFGTTKSLMGETGLGEPVAVGIPLFAALALCVRRSRTALLCGLTAVLAWLSVLQIAERASFIAVCAGLLLLASASVVTPRFRPRGMMRVALLGLAFVACLVLQAAPSPFERGSQQQSVLTRLGATSHEDLNSRARFLYWAAAVEMWRARPLTGVGAGGFSSHLPEARTAFASSHPDSSLTGINEQYLCAGAHNEYLQIFAELGAFGFALFVVFCAALVWAAWRALRVSRGTVVPGAVASLAVFAVSSGASAISFRWMGSGLMFFFAAALVVRYAFRAEPRAVSLPATVRRGRSHAHARGALAFGFALSLLVVCVMATQAASVLLIATAQTSADDARAESLYRFALTANPLNPATQYHFGTWLFYRKRDREATAYLRYALARGFNTSTCYGYLAGAESGAGEPESAERTLAEGVRAYPRSVFLRARHASALARLGRTGESELEMSAAILLDSRAARGWRQLIDNDIDAAIEAVKRDPGGVAMPGELEPEDAVFAVLEENERRFPQAVTSGWRAHMRSNLVQ
jgi:O-antigen ligase